MTVSVGDNITAAQYNGLQSRIATILGNGSGTNGYGQTLTSSQVSAGSVITAAQFDNLRTDLNKANNHQSGSNAGIGDIAVGQVIGADASGTSTGALTVTDEGFNDYEAAVGVIESNKYSIDSGNSSVEAGITSQRVTTWGGGGGGTITHTLTVDFADADTKRFFFNSGGEIRFSASLTGQSGSKSNDWATLLSNMGTIKFNYTSTTSTGTGTGQAIGADDLTGTYQQIFIKSGSGVYAENDYNIEARHEGTGNKTLRFKIEFRDDDLGDQVLPGSNPGVDGVIIPGPAEDEAVNGTITSTVQQLRATGANVEVTGPSYTNVTNL